ncbi:MAG: hypothetical protein ACTSRG_08290 [Candidatus Helarchaeota archaeon]
MQNKKDSLKYRLIINWGNGNLERVSYKSMGALVNRLFKLDKFMQKKRIYRKLIVEPIPIN